MNRWLLLAAIVAVGASPAPGDGAPVTRAAASVVQVQTPGGVGTGFVIGDGRVVTAAHVVEGAPAIVTMDGHRHQATILATDARLDLAVLRVAGDVLTELAPLELSTTRPDLADDVYALTAPHGAGSITVSRGIVSGFVDLEGREVLQTDAAINPGSSGGPVISASGEVLGVISSKLEHAEGVGYAVLADEVDGFLLAAPSAEVPAEPSAEPPPGAASTALPSDLQLTGGLALLAALIIGGVAASRRRERQHAALSPFHLDIELGPVRTTSAPDLEGK